MMDRLAHQQQALVGAILGAHGTASASDLLHELLRAPWPVGLDAYRGNARATADRALAAAFPVLRQMIGPENFAALAWAFWRQQPPACGDLAQWGAMLPDFVERASQLAEAPYLADLCRVEWAIHRASSAADVIVDAESFNRLSSQTPQTLSLVLAPGTSLVSSRWPVVTLLQAHQRHPPDLREAAQRLRLGIQEHALIWRRGLRPVSREIMPAAASYLRAALSGASLQALFDIEDAGAEPVLDWIGRGVREGWLCGLMPLAPSHLT